ncbi:hypothetical protein B0H34DRAFT_800529 [Crassisporium funariophilum]|nr:hypothetical protein B0H34DRAFT_800529 [Crassisporium funariophilum]
MHRCLYIPEILAAVFEEVNNCDQWDIRRDTDRQSILALVKTCRTFSGPALQILWRALHSPVPLLLTMPDDLWELESIDEGSVSRQPRTLSFKRDVKPSDWQRFDFYAPLVRQLGYTDKEKRFSASYIVIDNRICIEMERRTAPLLPNLHIMVVSSNDLVYTSTFLTPQVRQLRLNMLPSHLHLLTLLAADIPIRAPSLQSLHLTETKPWKPAPTESFSISLARLLKEVHLDEFVCDWFWLYDPMMADLLEMPSMQTLEIKIEVEDLARVLAIHAPAAPTLKAFSVLTANLHAKALHSVLIALKPSKLNQFRVTSSFGSCTANDLGNLILAVESDCSPVHFNMLHIETGQRYHPLHIIAVGFSILKPLLRFSNLTNLSLPSHSFDLTDAEVKLMAMAWPHLHTLLPNFSQTSLEPKTTMKSLLWFAIYCRELKSLRFHFSGTCELLPHEMAQAANHKLAYLTVGLSYIDDSEKAASFLKSAFPNLKILMRSESTSLTHNLRWQKVETLFQCY